MSGFFNVITMDDVAFAFIAALVLTFLIKKLKGGYRFVGIYRDIVIDYDVKNIHAILKSCHELFPKDSVIFGGDTFKRGSRVQVLTVGNRMITGELIGANNDGMICLLTASHIIAKELSHILDITLLDSISVEDDCDKN